MRHHGRDIFDRRHMLRALSTDFIGRSLLWRTRTGSTNDVAMEAARRGCPDGTLVVAETQTRGRGRMGRRWSSPRGGIWASVVLRSDFYSQHPGVLALMGALAVARAVEKGLGISARIKWPNDVEVNGKKLAGILGEAATAAPESFAILGIGINANIAPSRLPRSIARSATSLSKLCGRKVSRCDFLALVLTHLEDIYLRGQGRHAGNVIAELKEKCSTLRERVRITGQERVEGHAIDIDPDGALLLRTDGGKIVRVLSGDVTILKR